MKAKAKPKKDKLSCPECGHFLSLHDKRGCRANWCCNCNLKMKLQPKETK